MAQKHPNKHIREAIEYAVSCGWTVIKGRDHAFAIIRCPYNCFCQKSVWSTPRVPEAHARDLIRYVDRCTVQPREGKGK